MDKESIFKDIIEINKDRVFRICCGYIRNPDERKDIYQEVLINIWRSLDAFRNESQVSTWLYRITVNTCLGHLRCKNLRNKFIDHDISENIELIPSEENRENQDELHRAVEHMYKCISTLSPVDRTIVSLYLEEVGSKEIAEILGISDGNVRVRLHRIKKMLMELLQEKIHGT
jgi:RNA polymerase sigma-70 factor (ECF subfamily)